MSAETARVWLSRAVALIGFWGAASLGGRSLSISLVCLLVAGAGWARSRPLSSGQARAWKWANIGVSLLCLAAVAYEPMMGDAIAALLCWLLAHGAWVHRGARSDRANLLLSLLVLCFGSVSASVPLILSLSVVWSLLAAPLLALSLLREDSGESGWAEAEKNGAWRLGLLVPLTSLAALSLLLLMPIDSDVDSQVLPGSGSAGAGGTLHLTEMGRITEDPGVVLRAAILSDSEGSGGGFYFPMERLDHFSTITGQWSRSAAQLQSGPRAPPAGLEGLIVHDITLERLAGEQLLGISDPVAMDIDGGSSQDDQGGWWRSFGQGRVNYRVWSRPDGTRADEEAGLSIPEGLDPRIRETALSWLESLPSNAGPRRQAEHLAEQLRTRYTYTRSPGEVLQGQSLMGFMLSSRKGHCTYFATTLALMLRSIGIDSRVVRGFQGGEQSPLDGVIRIRRSDAHAWVEARIDGRWSILDGTPSASALVKSSLLDAAGEWVLSGWIGLMLTLQATEFGILFVSFLSWLESRAVGLVLFLISLLVLSTGLRLGGVWWRRHQKKARRGPVARQYDRARELVLRKGWRIPEQLPPRQAARWLVSRAGALAEPLETLAWLHYRVRYGGEADRELESEAEMALAELRVLPRRRRA